MSQPFRPVVRVPEFLSRVVVDRSCVIACLSLWVVSGCGDVAPPIPSAPPAAQARTSSLPPAIQTGSAVESAPESSPPAAPAAEPVPVAEQTAAAESAESSDTAQPRKIIGKTTTDVRDAAKEVAKGAKKVQPRITGQDPITVSGNAYSVIVGRAEQLQIKHSLDLFHGLNNRYPKDLQEFMKEIIKANGIRLAQLPFYQEYGYDAVKHELVILEYPDKKAQLLGGGK